MEKETEARQHIHEAIMKIIPMDRMGSDPRLGEALAHLEKAQHLLIGRLLGIATVLLLSGCLAHPAPNPNLEQLCARHGCDAGAPSIDELRAIWYADADAGAEKGTQ